MIIKPPSSIFRPKDKSVFLAGSIEMGKAEDWQARACQFLDSQYVTIYNPRRDNWDSSWEQSLDNEKFTEQVKWELDHLDYAAIKLFYFAPETKSPISDGAWVTG